MSVRSLVRNREFAFLLLANTILASAFPIQLVLGGLAGVMLAPDKTLATIPSSIQTLAGLVAASPFSLLMGRVGRRAGFILGSIITALGGFLAIQSIHIGSFPLLCAGHFLMGAGWASFQYFRFAAAEVVEPNWQPVSISLMLTSGLVAAIVGPQIFIATRDAFAPIPFVGAYAAMVILALSGIIPLLTVRLPLTTKSSNKDTRSRIASLKALRDPAIKRAIGIAAISQGVMVFLMIPTPIAIVGCGFSEPMASDVIRWHIVAMFAPSFFTGFLIKRFGASKIVLCGFALLLVASLVAGLGLTTKHFYASLIILGLGWNFGFVGATAMLAAVVSESDKAVVQGVNDSIVALASTICAFSAGIVVATMGWLPLAIISACIVSAAVVCFAMTYKKTSVP